MADNVTLIDEPCLGVKPRHTHTCKNSASLPHITSKYTYIAILFFLDVYLWKK